MGTTRILVIEDHIDGARALQLLLQSMGYEVAVAHTGIDGVRMAMEWEPDVVISDIGLPGLDGFEVARQLRHNPVTANAWLVAVGERGTAADKEEAANAGFNSYFVKPLGLEILWLLLSSLGACEETQGLPVSQAEPQSPLPGSAANALGQSRR
jgi:DNA-binding response OmpR family regulator